MREIVYSTRPPTLGLLVLVRALSEPDPDPRNMVALLLARTDLTEEEVLALDMDEVDEVLVRIRKGVEQAQVLAQLGHS